MSDIDDNILRKAENGDKDSILAVLRASNAITSTIIEHIDAAWNDDSNKRVAAIKYKIRRRARGIPLPKIVDEIVDRFGFPSNIAKYLAFGSGYAKEQEEARRQHRAEADAELSNE